MTVKFNQTSYLSNSMQALLARAMTEMFLLASLALLSGVSSSSDSFYDFEYIWGGQSYGQKRCIEIPEDMQLCHDVGYAKMLLPNLLEHDTMTEVKQQAMSWVPLVHRRCHPGTQVFLCSLFSPVCLEKTILPCQLFCQSVRDACSPVMEAFGFFWPEMLNCSRFPLEENEMCINKNDTETLVEPEHVPVCPQCDIEMKAHAILENMCASEFAIKATVKKTLAENVDKKVILQKRKKAVWGGPLSNPNLKKLVLYLKNGSHCLCHQLDNLTKNHYLIMGRKMGAIYLLTGIYKWDEKNREFKRFLNQIKSYECPAHQPAFK